ncbi:hypothetical protein M433DRAFT_72405 [Acidomyces richmondensis BFW]|nr:MAG: hypothetical protein FE78DRAFT_155443 [Acidomyces sp. 'richmondensis']KYG43110.1 hypothetical protein M433DRAFT_72405 [Acidomyces richmondensis BFW]
MASPHPLRTGSQDSTDGIRKRVCKACDRCRLKKSKCDGAHPCSRCKADNAICVFGERKKSHDKIYPKGYVEMLEQQQSQLVSALQEMYRRLRRANAWDGPQLSEATGHPLTHDILAALNLLEPKNDGSGDVEVFEEDCQKLQSRLLADGAGYAKRRGSFSSDSDHSQHSHSHPTRLGTPLSAKRSVFRESFNFASAPPSPLSQSPAPQPQRILPSNSTAVQQPSPLTNDPQFYQAAWSIQDMNGSENLIKSKSTMQAPGLQQGLSGMEGTFVDNKFDAQSTFYDTPNQTFDSLSMSSYPPQFANVFGSGTSNMQQDFGLGLDLMEFIEVTS